MIKLPELQNWMVEFKRIFTSNDADYLFLGDGAGLQLRDQGGYGVIAIGPTSYAIGFGCENHTTVNRMELRAVIDGVRLCKQLFNVNRDERIIGLTDSRVTYLGWKNRNAKANLDLWNQLFTWIDELDNFELKLVSRDLLDQVDRISKLLSGQAKKIKKDLYQLDFAIKHQEGDELNG